MVDNKPKPKETPKSLFDRIKDALLRNDLVSRSIQSMKWLTNKIKTLGRGASPSTFLGDRARQRNYFQIGSMYLYLYDAKWKDKLPYWDKFPLVIPIEQYDDGFLGLNLHYLPPTWRALLLDRLMDLVNNKNFDASTKMKISYGILKGSTRYKAMEPCIKRYLYSQIRSKFILINPDEWHNVIFLSFERFAKVSKGTVWAESLKKIKG